MHLTCLILLQSMFIPASLILYFFPFGVKIMKFVFSVFNETLLVLNQVENFMQLNIYFLNKSVEACV